MVDMSDLDPDNFLVVWVRVPLSAKVFSKEIQMGCSQEVRHWFLAPTRIGSNPITPVF